MSRFASLLVFCCTTNLACFLLLFAAHFCESGDVHHAASRTPARTGHPRRFRAPSQAVVRTACLRCRWRRHRTPPVLCNLLGRALGRASRQLRCYSLPRRRVIDGHARLPPAVVNVCADRALFRLRPWLSQQLPTAVLFGRMRPRQLSVIMSGKPMRALLVPFLTIGTLRANGALGLVVVQLH